MLGRQGLDGREQSRDGEDLPPIRENPAYSDYALSLSFNIPIPPSLMGRENRSHSAGDALAPNRLGISFSLIMQPSGK